MKHIEWTLVIQWYVDGQRHWDVSNLFIFQGDFSFELSNESCRGRIPQNGRRGYQLNMLPVFRRSVCRSALLCQWTPCIVMHKTLLQRNWSPLYLTQIFSAWFIISSLWKKAADRGNYKFYHGKKPVVPQLSVLTQWIYIFPPDWAVGEPRRVQKTSKSTF